MIKSTKIHKEIWMSLRHVTFYATFQALVTNTWSEEPLNLWKLRRPWKRLFKERKLRKHEKTWGGEKGKIDWHRAEKSLCDIRPEEFAQENKKLVQRGFWSRKSGNCFSIGFLASWRKEMRPAVKKYFGKFQ